MISVLLKLDFCKWLRARDMIILGCRLLVARASLTRPPLTCWLQRGRCRWTSRIYTGGAASLTSRWEACSPSDPCAPWGAATPNRVHVGRSHPQPLSVLSLPFALSLYPSHSSRLPPLLFLSSRLSPASSRSLPSPSLLCSFSPSLFLFPSTSRKQ